MVKKKYLDLLKEAEDTAEYWSQTSITDFTEEVARLMKQKNVSRTELATRLSSSSAYVTKLLRGNVNFTLTTMTKLARALGTVLRVHLAPEGAVVHWEDQFLVNKDFNYEIPVSHENTFRVRRPLVTTSIATPSIVTINLH